MANNSCKGLVYQVTFESLANDESVIAAFASSAEAESFLFQKAMEDRLLNGCFRIEYDDDEGSVTCWLDQSQPDDKDVYRIRKTL